MQLLPIGSFGDRAGLGAASRSSSSVDSAKPGWVHGVAEGFTPFTRPTAGAMSTFIELLTTQDDDKAQDKDEARNEDKE
jgi:hypothetical protein